ncbi:MAG: peptide chain release factor N(5)-glutamine methyltransferase [Rhodomicrobium sp.]
MLDLSFPEGKSADQPKTLDGAVQQLAERFRQAGLSSPRLDASILTAEACGLSREELILEPDAVLSAGEAARIATFAARRLAREPVSRILGRREFWGLSFRISPATLDPRPETELLVETVLSHVKSEGLSGASLRILDLGTGSGCILGAILTELPRACGIGLDRSEAALAAAQDNLSRLGLLDRVSFLCANWMSAIGGSAFDVIVCNPPYIAPSEICELEPEVRAYDPYLGLSGGEDGLEAYRIIIPQAFVALRQQGLLVVEVGYQQGMAVLDLMKHAVPNPGFSGSRILTDSGATDRAVAGVRQW